MRLCTLVIRYGRGYDPRRSLQPEDWLTRGIGGYAYAASRIDSCFRCLDEGRKWAASSPGVELESTAARTSVRNQQANHVRLKACLAEVHDSAPPGVSILSPRVYLSTPLPTITSRFMNGLEPLVVDSLLWHGRSQMMVTGRPKVRLYALVLERMVDSRCFGSQDRLSVV